MGLAVVGVVIDLVVAGLTEWSGAYPPGLTLFMFLVASAALGGVLLAVAAPKAGAWVVMIASIPFIPIGLIGFYGALQILREERLKRWEA